MNKNKGLILILGTAFISGLSVFVNKFGIVLISPYIFTGLKGIVVALLAISWLLMMKDWKTLKKLTKKQWLILSGIGLIGGSIPFLLFFKGLSLTTGIQAAFIHKTMFIYIAILAFVFLKAIPITNQNNTIPNGMLHHQWSKNIIIIFTQINDIFP